MLEKLLFENDYTKYFKQDKGNYSTLRFDSNDGVVVLLSTVGGYILVNHERLNGMSLETVRGFLEDNEEPVTGAEREVKEELGLTDEDIAYSTYLGYGITDNAVTTQKIHYVIIQLSNSINEKISLQTEEGVVGYKWVDREDIVDLIKDNTIIDNFTLSAFAKLGK